MRKFGGVFIVGVIALCIGVLVSVQISTAQSSDQGGLVPFSKVKASQIELDKARAERETALKELLALEERLEHIEKEKAEDDFFIKGVVADLEKYKISSGMLDVRGPGVVITIDDPLPSDEYVENDHSVIMINSDLLLSVINRLKEAGAEAISINGHRIVPTTEISLAGDNVNINSKATAPPYEIRAIGNPETIESAITIRSGIIDRMKSFYRLRVNIEKKDDITVTRYNGVIKFRYAAPVEPVEPAGESAES
ncbi:MAG: DUF881 domain-containing protein [Clostridiales Family XIII bacterium]|jgi:uncharacterized protein YlxW (UPF0749 family)|nr:DUF881 domain-containing protein [Clostridiales Family XIII bacterium]